MSATVRVDQWIQAAIRDLPAAVQRRTEAELLAHFADAVDDYVGEGVEPAQAEQWALRDLGDGDLAGDGFRHVHRGERSYLIAMLASIGMLFTMFGIPVLHEVFGLEAQTTASDLLIGFSDLLLTGLTVTVLVGLKRLLMWQFGVRGLDRWVAAIAIGLLVAILASTLSRLIYGYAFYDEVMRHYGDTTAFGDGVLLTLGWTGRIVSGVAVMALGHKIWQSQASLFGLGWAVVGVTLMLGMMLALTGPLVLLGIEWLAYVAYHLVMVAHALLWPLLILVFFRAVYSNPTHPRRAVS